MVSQTNFPTVAAAYQAGKSPSTYQPGAPTAAKAAIVPHSGMSGTTEALLAIGLTGGLGRVLRLGRGEEE